MYKDMVQKLKPNYETLLLLERQSKLKLVEPFKTIVARGSFPKLQPYYKGNKLTKLLNKIINLLNTI
jgi:hypothetical protein